MRYAVGDRVSARGRVVFGCSAVVLDADRRILLTRRRDNGIWCLPGGHLDAGESAEEACLRELHEETGLIGRKLAFVGLYSSPHIALVDGPDSVRQVVEAVLAIEVVGGSLRPDPTEVTDIRYFSADALAGLDIAPIHVQPVADGLAGIEGRLR